MWKKWKQKLEAKLQCICWFEVKSNIIDPAKYPNARYVKPSSKVEIVKDEYDYVKEFELIR